MHADSIAYETHIHPKNIGEAFGDYIDEFAIAPDKKWFQMGLEVSSCCVCDFRKLLILSITKHRRLKSSSHWPETSTNTRKNTLTNGSTSWCSQFTKWLSRRQSIEMFFVTKIYGQVI